MAAVAILAVGPALAEPKDTIKNHKYEVKSVPYNDAAHVDPFEPQVPLKTAETPGDWKVRIASLRLSSVIVGRSKVAVFNELHGPVYSYILVNGVLLGPDRKPVPGIAGVIEPGILPGEYRVTLRQGAEKVDYSIRNLELLNRKQARLARQAKGGSGSTNATGGGS
jgi:hypothetical protein